MGDEAAEPAGRSVLPSSESAALVQTTSPAALVIILPLPPKGLSPNARPAHWGQRSPRIAECRQHARFTSLNAVRPAGGDWPSLPLRTPVLVDVIATYRIRRRRDSDNLLASCKPIFDGIVDAGLIPDDSSEYLRINSVTIRVDPKHRGDGLRLLLWEAPLANTEEEKG